MNRDDQMRDDLRFYWRLIQRLIDLDLVSSQWGVEKALAFLRVQHPGLSEYWVLMVLIKEIVDGNEAR